MNAQAKLAALFLLLATGPLAEVLSQNVQLLTFVQPLPFLLVTLTYGVPVLLIRELAIARNLNVIGIVLLGIAYGILNEGVLAKTLTQPGGPPLYDFAGYGQVGAIQGGWSVFMVFWHAPHSVLYPLLLVHWLFPAVARERWFATGWARWLLVPLLLVLAWLYSLYFLNPLRNETEVFVVYAVVTLGLIGAALRFRRAPSPSTPAVPGRLAWAPVAWGVSTVAFYLFQFWSPGHLPFVVFLVVSVGVIAFAAAAMARAHWQPLPQLLLFGLGDYLAFAVLSAALAVASDRNPGQALVAGAIFVVVFLALVLAVRRAPLGRGTAGSQTD